MKRNMNRIVSVTRLAGGLAAIGFFLITTVTALAQLPTATIQGAVKDTSGAVIPEVSLTARNIETGQSRTVVSAADGSYRLSGLPVGSYEVRAEHTGFQSALREGLTLTIGQEAVVSFTLQVGGVEQTVSVTAEAPLVNTTSGSLGGLVDEQKVADLPLNGRNYAQLTLLQPGVMEARNKAGTESLGTWYSSNGAPVRSNNYMLDGAIITNWAGTGTSSLSGATLGVEGIREYRLITNSFSAEYGMTMGSQMVMVSKGGTNSYHGSLLEYLRNSHLDARNFFDRQTALTPGRLPQFKRNNFGGSVGGPIRRDKLFFFGTYEGLRERLGLTTISNTIPNSARIDGGAGGVAQIAPIIKPLLALYPAPNLGANQVTFPYSQPDRDEYGQMRVDHTVSAKDSWFTRYTIIDGARVDSLAFQPFVLQRISRAQFATLAENYIFSPSVLNTFRYSYSRYATNVDSPSGIIGPQYSFITGQEVGNISIGGVSGFGPNNTTPNVKRQNVFTWSDDLFYTRGRHAFKFGTLINRYQQFFTNGTGGRGTISFANLTDFLNARPNQIAAETPGSQVGRTYFYTTLGFYAQDDWKVRPNFTLNLGLRYEVMTQPHEVRGLGAALVDTQRDASTTLGVPYLNPTLRNFSPRFGFAWDVKGDGKTALRGGFGRLFDIGNSGNILQSTTIGTPPFSSQSALPNPPLPLVFPLTFPPDAAGKSLAVVDYHLRQPHMMQYNVTVERQLPGDMAMTLAYAGSRGFNLLKLTEGNPKLPQVLADGREFWPATATRINPAWTTVEVKIGAGNSWYNSMQFSLLKRMSRGLQFQSSYTWSKVIDENQGLLGVDNTGTNSQTSNPFHREVDRGPAAYDVTHNWRFNAIYRLPDFVSSGGVAAKLLNGWWTSGILSLATGYPFTANLSTNRSRAGVADGAGGIDRPDLVRGRNNSNIVSGTTAGCLGVAPGQKLGTPNLYFDPCAFSIPAAGFLGTAGRDILRGPGTANLDFSLVKDSSLKFLGESGKLQFRAEVFNLLNRASFAIPALAVFAARADAEAPLANAGVITQTAIASRQIQFALKLVF